MTEGERENQDTPSYCWEVTHGESGFREYIPGESESVQFDFDYPGNTVQIIWWGNTGRNAETAGESSYVSPDEWERDPEKYDRLAQRNRERIVNNALNQNKL